MRVFARFAYESEIPFNKVDGQHIALAVESDFNTLSTMFELQADQNGYEHYTEICEPPPGKRAAIAEEAISEAFREVSPVLPKDDTRLFIYGSRLGLLSQAEEEIREGILDDMGRVAGYDNEKFDTFSRILLEPEE
jgi:hypothetical protein